MRESVRGAWALFSLYQLQSSVNKFSVRFFVSSITLFHFDTEEKRFRRSRQSWLPDKQRKVTRCDVLLGLWGLLPAKRTRRHSAMISSLHCALKVPEANENARHSPHRNEWEQRDGNAPSWRSSHTKVKERSVLHAICKDIAFGNPTNMSSLCIPEFFGSFSPHSSEWTLVNETELAARWSREQENWSGSKCLGIPVTEAKAQTWPFCNAVLQGPWHSELNKVSTRSRNSLTYLGEGDNPRLRSGHSNLQRIDISGIQSSKKSVRLATTHKHTNEDTANSFQAWEWTNRNMTVVRLNTARKLFQSL